MVRRSGRGRARLAAAAAGMSFAVTSCRLSPLGMLDPVTAEGARTESLWNGAVLTAFAVGGLVLLLLAYALIRFRARDDRLPDQREYHLVAEITYTVVPIAIVAVLFGFTVRTQHDVLDRKQPEVVVGVDGFKWGWTFRYEQSAVEVTSGLEPPEIVLPVDQVVRFRITGVDVIHSFYVPRFLFKYDAIPGKVNVIDVTIDEPGTYTGRCAEFCGLAHANMDFRVRAVTAAEYAAWIDARRPR